MAKTNRVRVILLVEDSICARFASAVLKEFGVGVREQTVRACPARSNGKQWVGCQYAQEVKAILRERQRRRAALLVVTDADEQDVAARVRRLHEMSDPVSRETGDEHPVFHWIPKWHIETWILALSGETVDESVDVKHFFERRRPSIRSAASEFARLTRTPDLDESGILPSLRVALGEARRLWQYLK